MSYSRILNTCIHTEKDTTSNCYKKTHQPTKSSNGCNSHSRLFSLSWNPFYIKTYQSHDNYPRPIALTKWF